MREYRYDKDGRLRPETDRERTEREQATAGQPRRAPTRDGGQEDEPIWGRKADRLMFGSRDSFPLAKFRRSDPEYDEFKQFYQKFMDFRKSTVGRQQPEGDQALISQALYLFDEYKQKQRTQLKRKIEKDRQNLPIKALSNEIVEAVKANKVVLIAADTGAGKSTQVPQYLLDAGFDRIAVTQPRRIACFSLARRVAHEMMDEKGTTIGYKVRFEGTRTATTKVLFLTEGVLLRQFASDPILSSYDVIVVDEVHERHITGDFLLGVLKSLISNPAASPNLRLILMSATINIELFSRFFDNAPVIRVPGRMHPVLIEYMPINDEDDPNLCDEKRRADFTGSVPAKPVKLTSAPFRRIMERIDFKIPMTERGDLLIFLSGMNEITALEDELRAYAQETKRWIILKLHSTLSVSEQDKVFDIAPSGVRKCILSTNIAETSVTIDGIRFIVDSGKVKEMAYDPISHMSRLSEYWISKSSAKQRAGRAGRTGPGECFRFYSKKEYENFAEFPVPELLRSPLQSVLLQIEAYGLGPLHKFPFLESPTEEAIEHAIDSLVDLQALKPTDLHGDDGSTSVVSSDLKITSLGRMLAFLPIDVVLGKMLVLASISDVVYPTIVIAAALTVQSPFVKVPENRTDILHRRRQLMSEHGDPITLLNIFSEWLRVKAEGNESSKGWCRRHGLEEQRLYEMVKLKQQYEDILEEMGLVLRPKDEDSDDVDSFEDDSNNHGSRRKRKRRPDIDLDWRDPAYRKRREQQQMLRRQKREQATGKRKLLKLDFENEDDGAVVDDSMIVENPEDVSEMSIDALDFALKQNATELLLGSDVESLTPRDLRLLKLIVCSGLYPHLALPDEGNLRRLPNMREGGRGIGGKDHMYHTKQKRFVSMHPTSVYSEKPEWVWSGHEQEDKSKQEREEEKHQSLEDLHRKPDISDLLCYVELLETNKPYLTNVLRVPGVAVCLLFAKRIDIAYSLADCVVDGWLQLHFPSEEIAAKTLLFGNWVRCAWDLVINQKLHRVKGEAGKEAKPSIDKEIGGESSWGSLVGTAIDENSAISSSSKLRGTSVSDWSNFAFIPPSIRRMRSDWEHAVVFHGIADFADVAPEDVSDRLAEFLDLGRQCTVNRLKILDVPKLFGYDPYKRADEVPVVHVTPSVRFFPKNLQSITARISKRLLLPDVELYSPPQNRSIPETVRLDDVLTKDHNMPRSSIHLQDKLGSNRKSFECPKCEKSFLFTSVEILKHRKSCA
ncbi:P-loop containing nucleoside triphosphate hydrolase protein [Cladochytrium replicatum]|nr:P-loop containing nucleoside triphosphate hydrolase protein [Cladochytrium replicatum]